MLGGYTQVSDKREKEKLMTIQELYREIGGDYDQAVRVLRMDKLIDKHIRRFAENDAPDRLFAAGDTMDPSELFEAAHALKGVAANLGLVEISDAASEIAEEYRPGNERRLTDDEVKAKINLIQDLNSRTVAGIRAYAES